MAFRLLTAVRARPSRGLPILLVLALQFVGSAPSSGQELTRFRFDSTHEHVRSDVSRLRNICRRAQREHYEDALDQLDHLLKDHAWEEASGMGGASGEPEEAPEPEQVVAYRLINAAYLVVLEDAATRQGESSPAFSRTRRAVDGERKALAEQEWPQVAGAMATMSRLMVAGGNNHAAWQFQDCAVTMLHAAHGLENAEYVHAVSDLGVRAARLGDAFHARSAAGRAWSLANRLRAKGPDLRAAVLTDRGQGQELLGEPEDAELTYRRALDILARGGEYDSPLAADLRDRIGRLIQENKPG